jgi:hypothetical protein
VALVAAGAALAGSIAAEMLLGARTALARGPLALDAVCALVGALGWISARRSGSAWRELARRACRLPLRTLWIGADLLLLAGAIAAGFGRIDEEPSHWRAIAVYAVVRAVALALSVALSRSSGARAAAVAAAFAGALVGLVAAPAWRSAATAGAFALGSVAFALGRGALWRLAPAAFAALPSLALAAAAWLPGAAPLAWASPAATASTIVALGFATLVAEPVSAAFGKPAPRARDAGA